MRWIFDSKALPFVSHEHRANVYDVDKIDGERAKETNLFRDGFSGEKSENKTLKDQHNGRDLKTSKSVSTQDMNKNLHITTVTNILLTTRCIS